MSNWIWVHRMDFTRTQNLVISFVYAFVCVWVRNCGIVYANFHCERCCVVCCKPEHKLHFQSIIYLLIDALARTLTHTHIRTYEAQATHYWRHMILLFLYMTKETTATIKANRAISLKNACMHLCVLLQQLQLHIYSLVHFFSQNHIK